MTCHLQFNLQFEKHGGKAQIQLPTGIAQFIIYQ
jgi:hypothetical protein